MEKQTPEVFKQSETLLNTSYDTTAMQNRIFWKCIMQLQKQAQSNKLLETTISTAELREAIQNKNNLSIASINELLTQLTETSLSFGSFSQDSTYALIAGFTYNKDTDDYSIKMVNELYQHVVSVVHSQAKLGGVKYAELNLNIMFRLRSTYSQKLYELLRHQSRYNKSTYCEITLEDLRFKFGLTNNMYARYTSFRTRVLESAIREINNDGCMKVAYSEIKTSRKVTSILFNFEDMEPNSYEEETFLDAVALTNTAKIVTESPNQSIDTSLVEVVVKETPRTLPKSMEKSGLELEGKLEDTRKTINNSIYLALEHIELKPTVVKLFTKDFADIDFSDESAIDALLFAEAYTLEELEIGEISIKEYSRFREHLQENLKKI